MRKARDLIDKGDDVNACTPIVLVVAPSRIGARCSSSRRRSIAPSQRRRRQPTSIRRRPLLNALTIRRSKGEARRPQLSRSAATCWHSSVARSNIALLTVMGAQGGVRVVRAAPHY